MCNPAGLQIVFCAIFVNENTVFVLTLHLNKNQSCVRVT